MVAFIRQLQSEEIPMKKLLMTLSGVLLVASALAVAQGNSDRFYASSERFGYTGVVSVYDGWADARSGRNARCSAVVWPQRDGAIFVVKNAPEYWVDSNIILTNWYANNGASPSDTNLGFFQLYDESADVWQNQKGSWSKDLSTFIVRGKGRNATYGSPDPMDYARLWNACAPAGSGETTKGTFLTYEYVLIATGLNGVADAAGFITNTTNASNYAGYFRGIFQNESATSPASNGYYAFDLQFNNTSWAALNNCGYDGGAPQTPPCSGLPAADDQFGGKK
jgi:hypothetical protein